MHNFFLVWPPRAATESYMLQDVGLKIHKKYIIETKIKIYSKKKVTVNLDQMM